MSFVEDAVEQLDGKLFALVVSHYADEEVGFVSKVEMVAHFASKESVSALVNGCIE